MARDDKNNPNLTGRAFEPHPSQAETMDGGLRPAGDLPQPVSPRRAISAQDPEFPVKNWDRYEVLGFLGQGGMGVVFRCQDRRLGREVAIKFVRVEHDLHLQRFMVEARAQARVDHAHVCKVFEVGEVEDKVFIAMQYIPGTSLDVASATLSLEQKVLVLRDAALGIHEAHRVGIIHRDLKPSNIMVERTEDGALHTFVMDFGLAKEWNQDVTETGSVLGTPAYMSPEQARGEVSRLDRRTDIYSLGATLYQVATGRPPVSGSNALEILSAIGSADVEPMRAHSLDIPMDLEAITLKCLEKDRSHRYDSAKAFADDLDRFLAGDPVLARPTGTWYRIQRKVRKHKQLAAFALASLVIVAFALGTALKTRRDAAHRERLAQQFTESMGHIESIARYSALSPTHDIRPDLKAVEERMAQLQLDMKQAGALANGPGNYALGRGYLTLDDPEKAKEHLQMAWDAGYREPREAYALSLVLGQEYGEKLLEAQRIAAPDQRESRLREIERTLRDPALRLLRQAKGSDVPSPAFLEAQMAFYEGHLDEALDRLKTITNNQPWFYEAPLLRGTLLQARAWDHWNRGERDEAHADFDAGRKDLTTATTIGRSLPTAYAALANLEFNALTMERYGQGQVEPAFERGMASVRTALEIQPDHVPSLILESSLLGQMANTKATVGGDAQAQAQEAVEAAMKAVEAGPARADARIALAKAYYELGFARKNLNLDPTEALAKSLQSFDALSSDKRNYTVWNTLGILHRVWAQYQAEREQDSTQHLSAAIAAFQSATAMEPHSLPAWINLGACLQDRAGLPHASTPDADLQAAGIALEEALRLNPKHFAPYFVLGQVRYAQALRARARGGDPRPDLMRSLELNRQGVAINSGIPQLHNGVGFAASELARTAWEEGEDASPWIAQSKAAYLQAIQVAPNQEFGYINLADLLIWKGRYMDSGPALQEAQTLLQKAEKLIPNNEAIIANAGHGFTVQVEQALRKGTDPSREIRSGEAALAKALALDPRNGDTLQYLGELRAATARWKVHRRRATAQDFKAADEAFAKATAEAPDNQELKLAWGQARSRLGHLGTHHGSGGLFAPCPSEGPYPAVVDRPATVGRSADVPRSGRNGGSGAEIVPPPFLPRSQGSSGFQRGPQAQPESHQDDRPP